MSVFKNHLTGNSGAVAKVFAANNPTIAAMFKDFTLAEMGDKLNLEDTDFKFVPVARQDGTNFLCVSILTTIEKRPTRLIIPLSKNINVKDATTEYLLDCKFRVNHVTKKKKNLATGEVTVETDEDGNELLDLESTYLSYGKPEGGLTILDDLAINPFGMVDAETQAGGK